MIGTVACAFGVLILLLAVVIIAPKAVDTETVKANVRSKLLQVAGVEIDFDHLILDFFPRPHVIIDQVDLAIPPGVKGKATSVTVQPEILPLFWGKMNIAGLYLESAETKEPDTLANKRQQANDCKKRHCQLAGERHGHHARLALLD